MQFASKTMLAKASTVIAAVVVLSSARIAWSHGGDDLGRAEGVVTAVGGATLPNTITLQTATGELTVTATTDTRFELDDEEETEHHGEDEGHDDSAIVAQREGESGGHGGHGRDDPAGDDSGSGGGGADDPAGDDRGQHGHHDEDGDGHDDDEQEGEHQFAGDLTMLVGHFIEVKYDPTTLAALKIEVETKFEVLGRVTKVSGQNVTITPFVGPDVTVIVDANTQTEVDDAPVTNLRDFLGLFVRAEYDPNTGIAREIEAHTTDRLLKGTIDSVDTAAGTLTLNASGDLLTFVVPDTANVNLDGQDALLADLIAGQQAQVQFTLDTATGTRTATQIVAVTPSTGTVTGVVTAASITSQAVTVKATKGRRITQTFKVNSMSTVTLNGKRVKVSRLKVGDKVEAQFARGRSVKVVRKLIAHGR